jgi:hypothetical protein
MPTNKQKTNQVAVKSTKRTGLKAQQYVDRLAHNAMKKFVVLAHSFPHTDFLDCDDYPYPGHHDIFEDTYRKLDRVTKDHVTITKFCVVTYRYGYMSMDCELDDEASQALTNKIDAILRAGERQSGHACTLCGAAIRTSEHLEAADPYHAFCKSHSQDEIDATFEAQFEPEIGAELGIEIGS